MTAPCTTICTPWATTADLCSPCDDYAMSAVLLEDSLDMASQILFEFTRRRWPGSCQDTVRPCRMDCPRLGGVGICGCGSLSQVDLGVVPVTGIVQVKVDGAVLSSARYRVDDFRWLVRLADADGSNPGWPSCQRLDRADTEDDTLAVTFTYGVAPPAGGPQAAASLGCQLALACQPEAVAAGRCRLPKRITTITRQGISLAVLDPLTLFRDGLTGLPEVDMWVAAMNRGVEIRGGAVIDPTRPRLVRRVGT